MADGSGGTAARVREWIGRPLTEAEVKGMALRDSGWHGWIDWSTGEAVSEEEHQAGIDRWVESQEAKGLRYSSRDGWVPKGQEGER